MTSTVAPEVAEQPETPAVQASPDAATRGRHRRRSVLAVAWQALAWGVVAVAAGVIVVTVLVPRVAGATPYTVLTGSMRPDHPPGSLVVVRPVEADDVAVGDVITYQRSSGQESVVTHRVVSVATGTVDGERSFRTQGDANPTPDPDPVLPVQVRGELWYAVPWAGHLHSWLSGGQRQWATYGVGAGLGVYALVMLLGAARDRRRRPVGDTR